MDKAESGLDVNTCDKDVDIKHIFCNDLQEGTIKAKIFEDQII